MFNKINSVGLTRSSVLMSFILSSSSCSSSSSCLPARWGGKEGGGGGESTVDCQYCANFLAITMLKFDTHDTHDTHYTCHDTGRDTHVLWQYCHDTKVLIHSRRRGALYTILYPFPPGAVYTIYIAPLKSVTLDYCHPPPPPNEFPLPLHTFASGCSFPVSFCRK